jgi:hypothetical protein
MRENEDVVVEGGRMQEERVEVRACASAGVDSRTYAAAVRAWLHGRVFRTDTALLVPGDATPLMIAEARRREQYGAVVRAA